MAELISAGPTSFATEGERQAAELLKQNLPAHWTVICNKIVPTQDGRSFEIDFIIIAKNWIFLLDEKSWHGRISGDDQLWVRANGSSERSPLGKIDYIAKIVASQLGYKVTPLKHGPHFTRGGVLLSAQDTYPQIHDPRTPQGLFLLSDVCQRLQKLDQQAGNPAVGQWQAKIKDALVGFANRPKVPKSINFLNIDDAISLRPNVRLFYASTSDDPPETRHLMVYDLGQDPLEAPKLNEFYRQEYKAIKKLASTGLTTTVQDPFVWSDDYLVITMTPPPGKSLKATPLPETREEFALELQLASACFKALDQIHSHDILHRALGPDTIYVQYKQPPKVMFTNFYAARTGTQTISPSLNDLSIENPYASIDVAIGYEFANRETDTFSLALILLERLSGTSIARIRPTVEDSILFPDQPRWTSFLSTELSTGLADIFAAILTPIEHPPITAREAANRFSALAQSLSLDTRNEEGQLLFNRYRIEHFLGQGMMARTYRVIDTSFEEFGSYVLKLFLRPDEVHKQAVAEYKALKNITSEYLPRIEYPSNDNGYVLMAYIPGPTLQQIENEFPWPLERWWTFAQHLLKAVGLLETHMLLHRDIKPANIILHETKNIPVLIDFGFAMQVGDQARIAGTPLYLPPETRTGETPPASTDRYALAIVLFRTLLNRLPFTINREGQRSPVDISDVTDPRLLRIARVLQRAVSNDPSTRPGSITELQHDLQAAYLSVTETATTSQQALKPQINPWVDNIRSLYRNSDTGNSNNRGLDNDFVRETYIQTALDKKLLPELLTELPRVLFLSGNPGDGKTAFLERVYQELKTRGGNVQSYNPSGWVVEYQGHIFRSCYDASESHEHLSADEQLTEKLQGLDGSQPQMLNLTVLVAINDGRLFDFFQRQRSVFPWLAQQVDTLADGHNPLGRDVWLIDMKQRAFVSLPWYEENSIFRPLLKRFVEPQNWSICASCSAQTVCPLRQNAQALNSPQVVNHLEYLFLITHLRRQHHITMRDLRSALAYIITGNTGCSDIHQQYNGAESGTSLTNLAYWQNTFATHNIHDDLLQTVSNLDPARFARPHLDRFLHFHQLESDAPKRRQLFLKGQDLSPQRFKNTTEWMAATKRKLYFEAAKNTDRTDLPKINWRLLLPYTHAYAFMKLLDNQYEDEFIMEELALGLLRSDSVITDVPAHKMTIKVSSSEEQQLVVLKQLPLQDFHLHIPQLDTDSRIELLPETVLLQHKSGTPRLEITLDLFELLRNMSEGLQPHAHEYAPLLEDLKPFKHALMLRETQELILIESYHRVHHVAQRDGKIIRQLIPAHRGDA